MTEVQRTHDDISSVVTAVSLALASASDDVLDAVIDDALGALARHQEADRAYVTLYSDSGTFSNSHEWVALGIPPHRQAIVGLSKDDFAWSVRLAERGDVWHCTDIEALPVEAAAEQRSFAAFGVKAVLQVPMRTGSRTIGVVGFNHLRSRQWSPTAIELVRRVADSIGYALLRREITRDLRAARDAAERANEAKQAFLSRVSHELRTPLHAILGFAELLDHTGLDPADRHAVRQILASGLQLQTIVDDLLNGADRPQ